jgi:hypothetical protein
MIRRVAFEKAVTAGIAGAGAWEVVVRVFAWLGFPVFDLVRVLGTMIWGPAAPSWKWWPVGMAMHLMVGTIWAIFYAYFFWSFFDLSPTLQGMVFAILPAMLAGFIMVPQMDLMLDGQMPRFRTFAIDIGVWGPLSIIIGHAVYGAVLGTIYVRPVGYAAGKKIIYG